VHVERDWLFGRVGVVLRFDAVADSQGDPVPDSTAAERLLTALLQIPAADAAKIRDRTPSRVRPRKQEGPTADYGDE
jgi:hypothetical protein